MCEAFAIHGKGKDWLPEINEAQNALYEMAVRGLDNDKFLFRGPEMQAVNLAMDVHDVQLEKSTVKQLEDMANFVAKQVILKRARAIVSKTERQSNAEQMQPA
jgi:hypothetical protein